MFCGTLAFHGTPVEEYGARLYLSTHTEIYFEEHNPTTHLLALHRNVF